jgi:hypothetical protein
MKACAHLYQCLALYEISAKYTVSRHVRDMYKKYSQAHFLSHYESRMSLLYTEGWLSSLF